MRILFVLDRVENPASANAQLACRLAEQLLAQGHEIGRASCRERV